MIHVVLSALFPFGTDVCLVAPIITDTHCKVLLTWHVFVTGLSEEGRGEESEVSVATRCGEGMTGRGGC